MKRKTNLVAGNLITFILLCQSISFSQGFDESEVSDDSLEIQQTYIRSLVELQKQQILRNFGAEALMKELDIKFLKEIDSIVAQNVNITQADKVLLKKAAKESIPRQSAFRKTLVIGGLSACAIAGVVVYFLTKDDSKNGTGADPDIVDKPPLHP